eukprot:2830297-Prymnesium_polylepis.1
MEYVSRHLRNSPRRGSIDLTRSAQGSRSARVCQACCFSVVSTPCFRLRLCDAPNVKMPPANRSNGPERSALESRRSARRMGS